MIPVFDGRLRYDLKLGFKQLAEVRIPEGYQGAALICSVSFVPLAGHDPNRFMFKYLAAQEAMEVWLVPIAGAAMLAPYRISIQTPMGLGLMEATQLKIDRAGAESSAR